MQPITCSHHMITLFLNSESLTGQKESDTGPLDYQRYQTCYADRRGLFNSIASIWFCERFFLFFYYGGNKMEGQVVHGKPSP